MSQIMVIGDSTPSFPGEFNRRLQSFDRDLWVTWHKPPTRKPGRWKIEMCVKHNGFYRGDGMPEHNHLCQRVYVMMVQDDEGTPIPLGEHVFAKLGEMRANVDRLGGATERGLRNFIEESNAIDQELVQKRAAESEDIKRHNRKFNRLTINRLKHLVDQHDLRPNK